MKSKKGISMIELVIVVVLIALIATFSIYSGKNIIDQAAATELYTEASSIMSIVSNINFQKNFNDSGLIEITQGTHYDDTYNSKYIIYGMDHMSEYENSNVRKFYGIDSIKHTYIVDFENVKVELLDSVRISNREVKTFDEIRSAANNAEI